MKADGKIDLRVISLGAGVQSSAMYLMACDGVLGPKPDVAIFADTQQEPPWVYENVWRLAAYGGDRIPIVIATAGDLGEAVRRKAGRAAGRFASVPFWTLGAKGRAVPGRRHCTRDYKIDVVRAEIRRQLKIPPRKWATRYLVEEWVGISTDEASRAKPSRIPWIRTEHPLLYQKPMSRTALKLYLAERGWPAIKKSSCVFCPYRQDLEWARWREEEPELFTAAVEWDNLIRDASSRGLAQKQYISRSLLPLTELPSTAVLRDQPEANLNLFENECEGMCGV